jgi:transcriptional regulator with XRE-family HTH domain
MTSGTTEGKDELSYTLRSLRETAGMSTREAGRRAGWSQAKISRLETGRSLPSPNDVIMLADIYQAPPGVRGRLDQLVHDVRAWSRRVVLNRGGNEFQTVLGRIEESSALIRTYSPAIIPGLLQTEDYARAIFTAYGTRPRTPEQLEATIAKRMERQSRVGQDGRQCIQITTEGALGWQATSPFVMAAQLDHLANLSKPGLEIGIIPWGTRAVVFPLHTWDMYDNHAVSFGTVASTALLTSRQDVDAYDGMFTKLAGMAAFGDNARAILARTAHRYRRLAKNSGRQA